MSVVYYKFKSAKDYDQAVFDGLGISVFDLKKEIMIKKKLGKGTDFDLAVSNAQTNEEYVDDTTVIPRNTSILVQRNPAKKPGRGTAQNYVHAVSAGLGFAAVSAHGGVPGAMGPTQAKITRGSMTLVNRPPPMSSTSYSSHSGTAATSTIDPSSTTKNTSSSSSSQQQQQQQQQQSQQQPTLDDETLTEEQRLEAFFGVQDQQWEDTQKAMELQRPVAYRPPGGGYRPRPPRPTDSSAAGSGGGKSFTNGSHGNVTGSSSGGSAGGGSAVKDGGYVPSNGYNDYNSYSNRPPPPEYICHRCLKRGHWKNQCPTLGDTQFDRPAIKKTTGIPKSFLKVVDTVNSSSSSSSQEPTSPSNSNTDPSSLISTDPALAKSNLMVTNTGDLVMVQVQDQAWQKARARFTGEARAAAVARVANSAGSSGAGQGGTRELYDVAPVLEKEFECLICKRNMREPRAVACCGARFCDECLQNHLIENDDKCFNCNKDITPDMISPIPILRNSIEKRLKEWAAQTGQTSKSSASASPSPAASPKPFSSGPIPARPGSSLKHASPTPPPQQPPGGRPTRPSFNGGGGGGGGFRVISDSNGDVGGVSGGGGPGQMYQQQRPNFRAYNNNQYNNQYQQQQQMYGMMQANGGAGRGGYGNNQFDYNNYRNSNNMVMMGYPNQNNWMQQQQQQMMMMNGGGQGYGGGYGPQQGYGYGNQGMMPMMMGNNNNSNNNNKRKLGEYDSGDGGAGGVGDDSVVIDVTKRGRQ